MVMPFSIKMISIHTILLKLIFLYILASLLSFMDLYSSL